MGQRKMYPANRTNGLDEHPGERDQNVNKDKLHCQIGLLDMRVVQEFLSTPFQNDSPVL
jgi:hypothetical protein